uniref:Armadillo repeat-containing domain-containing protein n=1 Tax=Schistosoma haematobium TaxID=6185 RepID=A0A094ZMW7_SCHHA
MVWAPETKSFLLKSKILNHISELNPRTLIKSRRGHFILTLWLQLILNISFTKDGQHILFNQPNLPTILINCINHCKPDNRETALVILRNLCTHNFNVINCFRDILLDSHLDTNSLYSIRVVLSAIEAAIHNSKKILILHSGTARFYVYNQAFPRILWNFRILTGIP